MSFLPFIYVMNLNEMEYYEYYVPYSLAAADLFLVIGKIAA